MHEEARRASTPPVDVGIDDAGRKGRAPPHPRRAAHGGRGYCGSLLRPLMVTSFSSQPLHHPDRTKANMDHSKPPRTFLIHQRTIKSAPSPIKPILATPYPGASFEGGWGGRRPPPQGKRKKKKRKKNGKKRKKEKRRRKKERKKEGNY